MISDEMVRRLQRAGELPRGLFDARAALEAVAPMIRAAALEEAVRIAEAKADEWWNDSSEKNYRTASIEVAAAIRALAKGGADASR